MEDYITIETCLREKAFKEHVIVQKEFIEEGREKYHISFNPIQCQYIAEVGARRHIEAITRGIKDRKNIPNKDNGWSLHTEGAAAEYAVAAIFGIEWDADINTFHNKPDLGGCSVDIEDDEYKVKNNIFGYEIRSRLKHNWDLPIRDHDPGDRSYILVTGKLPNFTVHGWYRGDDARKKKEWRRNYGGHGWACFVPQYALKSLSELTKIKDHAFDVFQE